MLKIGTKERDPVVQNLSNTIRFACVAKSSEQIGFLLFYSGPSLQEHPVFSAPAGGREAATGNTSAVRRLLQSKF